jgi:hypothetical protein
MLRLFLGQQPIYNKAVSCISGEAIRHEPNRHVTFDSFTLLVPLLTASRPLIIISRVLLPEPFCPTIAVPPQVKTALEKADTVIGIRLLSMVISCLTLRQPAQAQLLHRSVRQMATRL